MSLILASSLLSYLQSAADTPPSGGRSEIIAAVVGAIVGAILSGIVTHIGNRTGQPGELHEQREKNRALHEELQTMEAQFKVASERADRYVAVREKLEQSSVVRTYHQPVLLLGPRGVGKTSLLMQWHAPWDHARLDPTVRVSSADVPVHDIVLPDQEPHFADPSIRTAVKAHLVLRVFDFPGELSAQEQARKVAIQETHALNSIAPEQLGIVLICMFNAQEIKTGLSKSTVQYYNGDLFAQLKNLRIDGKVVIERVVLVFNRYDELRFAVGHERSDDALLDECLKRFEPVYDGLFKVCNHERVCATFSALSREHIKEQNRGAPIVLGEAARSFVRVFGGKAVVAEVVKAGATQLRAARYTTPSV